ncbi:MAG: DUF177 domain-containing protein [Kiritimatiellae bacterium]|nr:DUF177 domain-containing protein [Kiritimatiellia bacterium]
MAITIDIAAVRGGRREWEGHEDGAVLGLAEEKGLRVNGAVMYRFTAELAGNDLIVRGRVSAEFVLQCSRCIAFFTLGVEDDDMLQCYAVRAGEEFVDLTDDVREAIILALPSHPVCMPDCKGLCPRCGQDLNKRSCGCSRTPGNGRWNALDGVELS